MGGAYSDSRWAVVLAGAMVKHTDADRARLKKYADGRDADVLGGAGQGRAPGNGGARGGLV